MKKTDLITSNVSRDSVLLTMRTQNRQAWGDENVAEGIAEATVKFVRNLLVGKDMSYEKIAKVADTSVDEVIRIANESGLAY